MKDGRKNQQSQIHWKFQLNTNSVNTVTFTRTLAEVSWFKNQVIWQVIFYVQAIGNKHFEVFSNLCWVFEVFSNVGFLKYFQIYVGFLGKKHSRFISLIRLIIQNFKPFVAGAHVPQVFSLPCDFFSTA